MRLIAAAGLLCVTASVGLAQQDLPSEFRARSLEGSSELAPTPIVESRDAVAATEAAHASGDALTEAVGARVARILSASDALLPSAVRTEGLVAEVQMARLGIVEVEAVQDEEVAAASSPRMAQEGRPVTLDDVRNRSVRWSTPAPSASWVGDGNVLRLQRGQETLFFDPEQRTMIAEPERGAAERADRVGVRGNALVLQPAEGDDRTLFSGPGLRLAQLAPRGRYASVVRGSDLVVVNVEDGSNWTIGDGDPDQLYGVLDWVYQEEVYGRGNFNGHWWSPSGDAVAFLALDESGVPTFTIVDHVPSGGLEKNRGVEAEYMRYPKAGDPNPVTRLGIALPGEQRVVWAKFDAMPEGFLVVRVGWSPDGGRLIATVQDRIQQNAWLLAIDPADGTATTLIEERSETWTERPDAPRWLSNETFLWVSHRTGYRHLYHYSATGELIEKLSDGDWDVTEVLRVDESTRTIWFTGTKDGALGENLYSTIYGEIDALPRATPADGSHRISFSANGRYFVDSWSSITTPTRARVVEAATGEVVLDLGGAEVTTQVRRIPRELVSIPARDGYRLDATVIVPDAEQWPGPRPVFLDTYSGPDAPSVSNAFRPSTWHQFLAQRGAIVLQVNVRSASGRGHAHTSLCYRQLGVRELMDLEDAVDWVVANKGGDSGRVAISGWSYGGFMAAYALTHSTKFALGLAGAGVYDWRLYDTIYTERYMSTPQDNPEGYAKTSVIESASKLSGHLVLMHGTMDDNVHVQNTIQLADALQKAGRTNFEMMLYANARHGVGSPHLLEYRWRLVKEYLGLTE